MASPLGGNSSLKFNKECKKKCIVVVCKDFFSLLSSVKAELTLVTTLDEVMDGLRKYIFEKKLFDIQDPSKICLGDDELGNIFGLSEFSILDISKILTKLVLPLPCDISYDTAGGISSVTDKASKRSAGDRDRETVGRGEGPPKRLCLSKPNLVPMFLHIPKSPIRAESASDAETAESIQGYETSWVKDTSDDNFWLEDRESDDDFLLKKGDMLTIAETYDIEYEVDSDFSTSCSDSDSEEEDLGLDTAIITVLCKTDSDQEFFADMSSDEDDFNFDAEISESDRWTCKNCGQFNQPPMRCCLKCWETRRGWLATESSRTPPNPKRKRLKKLQDKKFAEKEESSSHSKFFDLPSTSEELLKVPFEEKSNSFIDPKESDKLCLICCSKPINSSIIHGKYCHSISCFDCGVKLKKRKKVCPICRRTIERVVHQISIV